ncbi:hypothetical protein N9934_02840 [Desulfosarcina sp.]|nr:hypothetical protein [Desulfosarcina sp.]
MKKTFKATYFAFFVTCSFLIGLLTASGVRAQDGTASKNKWQFEITPYFLAAAMKGEVGTGTVDTDIDMSFEDIWDNLDVGLMGIFEARKGRWIFAIDAVYFRLNKEETKSWTGPQGLVTIDGAVEATLTQQLYQGSVGYRVVDKNTKFDLIGGLRYTIVENDLDLVLYPSGESFPGDTRNLNEKESWTDPVFGVRVLAPFSKKWSFFGYGDIGGFGIGSDITYQALAGIRWQFSKVVSAKLAYRYLYQDFEEDDFKWDMSYQGPVIGIGFSF